MQNAVERMMQWQEKKKNSKFGSLLQKWRTWKPKSKYKKNRRSQRKWCLNRKSITPSLEAWVQLQAPIVWATKSIWTDRWRRSSSKKNLKKKSSGSFQMGPSGSLKSPVHKRPNSPTSQLWPNQRKYHKMWSSSQAISLSAKVSSSNSNKHCLVKVNTSTWVSAATTKSVSL